MEENNSFSMTTLPLFQALSEHMLIAGVPKEVLIVLAGISIFFIWFFSFFYILLLTLPLYMVAAYLSRTDAQFFDCYQAYVKKNSYYCT